MFRYTALGDSITAGMSVSSPPCAYPQSVIEQLRKRGVAAVGGVLAHPGWSSRDLTEVALDLPLVPFQCSDAVSIWIGGNDVAYAGLAILQGAPEATLETALIRYGEHLTYLVETIRQVGKARIVLCTQYDPFPNSPLSAQAVSALNRVTMGVARRYRTALAPVHEWFVGREAEWIHNYRSGRLEDVQATGRLPIHPNDAGHAGIARRLVSLLCPVNAEDPRRRRAIARSARRGGDR